MGGRERRGQTVVLDDGAAPLRVAHGAHVRHPQGVAGGGSTQVLGTREGWSLSVSDSRLTLAHGAPLCLLVLLVQIYRADRAARRGLPLV